MRSLAELFQKKETKKKQIDEKTILYIVRNVILCEYGNCGGENIHPTSYKEGKLFLLVSGSIWESEILLQKTILKRAINEKCGKGTIREIYIKK